MRRNYSAPTLEAPQCCLTTDFWATVTNNGSPYATGPLSYLSVLSVCNVGVLRLNGWMDQDATWYGGRPRPRRHCVRWGPMQLPKERVTAAPNFSAHVCCDQTTVAHLSNC